MKISVVIGTCHGEEYIAEQLLSLFHQTLPPYEILIGDDSGDSKTVDEINRVKCQFSGDLRIICNPPESRGIIRNYLNLAKKAKGDIIFFADQDDFWLPEKIEKMTEAFQTQPEKMVVVCNSEVTDQDLVSQKELLLDRTPAFYRFASRLERGDWESFREIFMQKFNFSAHNMAMKKEIRDLFVEMPEDYLFHDIWLAQISSLAGKLFYLDEVLTLYRQHGNNASGPLIRRRNKVRDWVSLFSHSTSEIEETWTRLNTIIRITEKYLTFFPEENMNKLKDLAGYYRRRIELHKKNLCSRLWIIIQLRGDYFRYGLGFRSLIRDLFIK